MSTTDRRETCDTEKTKRGQNPKGGLETLVFLFLPNFDDKGNLIGTIGIHLDITEQKQLEIELEKEQEKALEASKAKDFNLYQFIENWTKRS